MALTSRSNDSAIGKSVATRDPAPDLLVELLDGVAGPEPASVLWRQREDGEGLGNIGVDPVDEVGCGLAMLGDDDVGSALRFAAIRRVDNLTCPRSLVQHYESRVPSIESTDSLLAAPRRPAR